ncbi:hypothetical protein FRB91_001163 [Serendipita sp. 411]|nr:hypothetical protein FRC18_000826 [Serendipita sp. 400]KAG8856158.1 hypothetical protein FRB91_001163 [Serendipita sp. 411]
MDRDSTSIGSGLSAGGSSDSSVPKVDQMSLGVRSSRVGTTYYADSMAERGENDDGASRITTATSVGTQNTLRREDGGRYFNALNDTYFLPSDDDEHARLNKQHTAITLGLGGLYPAPEVVNSILANREGDSPKVLDLGCGTGIWALSVAREFPHCQVVGIDLAPVPVESDSLPENCRFEVDDINNGLSHFYDSFDLVHARLIASGLRDFRKSKAEIEKCLKPGGIMIWMDGDYDILSRDRNVYSIPASEYHPDGSWLTRFFYEMRRFAVGVGRSDIFTMIDTLSGGLWDDELLDPATCQAADLILPVGPWVNDADPGQNQRLKFIGTLMQHDFKNAHRATHPPLTKAGLTPETLTAWSDLADKEMTVMEKPMWFRFIYAWGRRRAKPGASAPPLPAKAPNPDYAPPPYPYFTVFDTPEQTRASFELRNRSKTFRAPPLPPALQH